MANGPLDSVVRHLRQLADERGDADVSDQQLLERFAAARDETAFALLVQRYGPLVLGVCRRVLRHAYDAEDAFQATFLVLADRAASIRKRQCVGNWLHGVAWRVARRARVQAARRRRHEKEAAAMRPVAVHGDTVEQDIGPVLDEELRRLPERYRLPLLLCYWQGKTHQAAARELACPVGTLSWRLARGRALLRQRLGRRGVLLSAGLLAMTLAAKAGAAVPAGLAAAAVVGALHFVGGSCPAGSAAVGLAHDVLRAMAWAPRQAALVLLLVVGMAAAGVGVFAQPEPAAKPAAAASAGEPEPAVQDQPPAGVDRFGDPLPAGVLARMGTVRLHQGNVIETVVWSPDGKLLASAGTDGSVRLWDAATGKELAEFSEENLGSVDCVVFSPDGKLLASAHRFGEKIHLWDVATRRPLRAFGGIANAVAFAPDGKTLVAVGHGMGKDCLGRWDVATGQLLQSGDTAAEYHALLCSVDGKLLAMRQWEGIVHLWDAAACRFLRPLDQQRDRANALAFAPDGTLLATADTDKVVRLWDPATGKEVRRLTRAPGAIQSVAFCDGGKAVVAGTLGGVVLTWDAATGKELARFQATGGSLRVMPSPDGKTLASWGDGCLIRLWDRATGKELRPAAGHDNWVTEVAWSPDGKMLATGSHDNALRLWDAATGGEVRRLPDAHGAVSAMALAPDGRLLASATWQDIVQVWETNTGEERASPDGALRKGRCVAWSPDGKVLAAGGQDGMVRLWDPATGRERSRFPAHPGVWVWCLAFAPDGKVLASGGVGRHPGGGPKDLEMVIHLWDVATGKELRTLQGHESGVTALAYSPDGQLLASGSHDGTLRVWDAATGQELRRFDGFRGTLGPVAFSPDGKLLSIGGDQVRTIRVWELATGKEALRLEGHRGWVQSVAFAPGGRALASGSADGTALVWDLAGRGPARGLTARQREALWADLAGADAATAYRAIWTLAAAPRETVPFLQGQLPPASRDDAQPKRIARLIDDLDADAFDTRESASAALGDLGEAARPALRRALAGDLSVEARRRVERLLEGKNDLDLSAATLRAVRAVTVLEQSGTPEARDVLRALAAGAPEARLTREAAAALGRLGRTGEMR